MKSELKEVLEQVLAGLSLDHGFSAHSDILAGIQDAAEALHAQGRSVHVLAIGKAAQDMTDCFLRHSALDWVQGILCTPYSDAGCFPGFAEYQGGHPVPNKDSFAAARHALDMAHGLQADDVLVTLLSGGASAAFEWPVRPWIHLEDLVQTYQALVGCGADIIAINTIRKHLSAVKGGRLAVAAAPARQYTFYVSDVPEGHEDSIASGPGMPDPTTTADARQLVERHHLEHTLPVSVTKLLQSSALPETPDDRHPAFARCSWHALSSNSQACRLAAQYAAARGWHATIDSTMNEAPVADAATWAVQKVRSLQQAQGGTAVLVMGGEVLSPVHGSGAGGRNTAFVMHCLPLIAGRNIAVLSAGTDGIDGNQDAAGAVADGTSAARALDAGLDWKGALQDADSGGFLGQISDLIRTGPTGTNVRDLRLLVAW